MLMPSGSDDGTNADNSGDQCGRPPLWVVKATCGFHPPDTARPSVSTLNTAPSCTISTAFTPRDPPLAFVTLAPRNKRTPRRPSGVVREPGTSAPGSTTAVTSVPAAPRLRAVPHPPAQLPN